MSEDILTLYSADGQEMRFERVAAVRLEGREYAVLSPLERPAGMGENQALVFEIRPCEDGRAALSIVTEQSVIESVFNVYLSDMLQRTEEQARRKDF
ncbi:MAG: DUF1292 domain-containing protein [Oscillospiraceae bacterium]|nr:DUF1292 domain-containing protein [Oscillospiraceae bacterium]